MRFEAGLKCLVKLRLKERFFRGAKGDFWLTLGTRPVGVMQPCRATHIASHYSFYPCSSAFIRGSILNTIQEANNRVYIHDDPRPSAVKNLRSNRSADYQRVLHGGPGDGFEFPLIVFARGKRLYQIVKLRLAVSPCTRHRTVPGKTSWNDWY